MANYILWHFEWRCVKRWNSENMGHAHIYQLSAAVGTIRQLVARQSLLYVLWWINNHFF